MDAARIAEEDFDDNMVLSVTIGDDGFQDVWVLDSGCPYHVSYKDVFSTYKSIEGGVILIGNDMPCKILGIGIVNQDV